MDNMPERKCNIPSNTNSPFITFIDNHEKEDISVEEDKPVIDYAKIYADSENIILYSWKLKAIIHPSVPCRALVKGEIEIIRRQSKKIPSLAEPNYDVCGEGHFFKVECKGSTKGNASRPILCDNKYNWKEKPLAVYGGADQTIEEAIQNDKRFNIPTEFSLTNVNEDKLIDRKLKLTHLKSDVVYTVQVKTSNIQNSKPDPKTQNNGGLQNHDEKAKDAQNAAEIKTEFPQTSSVSQSDPKVQTRKMPQIYRTPLSKTFSCEFEDLGRTVGSRELRTSIINDHIKYKKPMHADTLKRLTWNLESVALIRYRFGEEIRTGTFFLLTDSLGLTCFHVLKPLLDSEDVQKSKLPLPLLVIFNYDDSDETKEYDAVLECCNEEYDFAFLSISKHQTEKDLLQYCSEESDLAFSRILGHQSKKGLLQYVAPPPQDGAVSIIGHPGGTSKKIDPICSVINFSKRAEAIAANILSDKSYIHVITEYNLMSMSEPELVTYDTCLYWGASGSPVFNDQGNLVAMHRGGYPARTDLEKKSIIEYGRNIIDILIFGAIQLEELISWFREVETQITPLTTYLKDYLGQGGHSVKMQPVIREFNKCFFFNGSPQGQNPDLDDSGIAESPMDTSA